MENSLPEFYDNSALIGYIKYKGCVLPELFTEFGDSIRKMDVRDDDIWVCSYPKTGSTWTQEMVWCIAHDVDLEAAKKTLFKRIPFLERTSLFVSRKTMAGNSEVKLSPYELDSVSYVNDLPSPRFIKTHLPFNLLPEKLQNNSTRAKIIYVIRNPKDTCISYYHHNKLLHAYKGSFEQFAESFLEGNVMYGSFVIHLKGYWQQRKHPNILLLKYEDMKQDLKSVICRTANFIEKNISKNDVEKLLHHLSFSSMQKNQAVNYEAVIEMYRKIKKIETGDRFIRKGEIGQWKGVMNSDLCERFEKWEKESLHEIAFTYLV